MSNRLTDRNAVQLSELLLHYFEDGKDDAEHPGTLTVRELLEDLSSSTTGDDHRAIEDNLDAILDTFDPLLEGSGS